ncbi:helix-turn-helix domain-containing protein [Actinokineospora sp. G85]|uniref:helix-turn-helix domain-containing protein n=1 Tax=Actinokineospora sp. G85 TaxID=3406626 RepID=UPI003C78D22E
MLGQPDPPGTTLADLSAETGIPTSTLSRLEAGLRRPTLEQLLPLARAHGVTVDAPLTGDPRVDLRPDDREPDLRTHDWVYVLNGTLRLVLGEFDTRTPHRFGATSAGPVGFPSLIGRQGERAHVRVAVISRPGRRGAGGGR